MQPTVKSLKLGSRVYFGAYSVREGAIPSPISWLKATPNGDFVSEFVLDSLAFDAKEAYMDRPNLFNQGNPNYKLSNLHQFLNSDEPEWFRPTHDLDRPPAVGSTGWRNGAYSDHSGFLTHFESHELDSIVEQEFVMSGDHITAKMRILSGDDLWSQTKFKLFNKKGIRAQASDDFLWNKATGDTMYVPYWICDRAVTTYSRYLGAGANVHTTGACNSSGIRPTCMLSLDTMVEQFDDDSWRILSSGVAPRPASLVEFASRDEIIQFLGLAQP